mmetsp:Transcript_12765/g.12789  ORF Transcript_12765/g.12789 Transcript_12765/m.12789 type:complete len:80 (+) Transcript_12765:2-241(+)
MNGGRKKRFPLVVFRRNVRNWYLQTRIGKFSEGISKGWSKFTWGIVERNKMLSHRGRLRFPSSIKFLSSGMMLAFIYFI